MDNTIKNLIFLKENYYKKYCDLNKYLDFDDIELDEFITLSDKKDDYFKRYKFYTNLLRYM